MKTLGFLGKGRITDTKEKNLFLLGRVIGKAGRELLIVPTAGSVTAVEMGVRAEEGKVRHIAGGVLTASAHSLVYADERLLTRIRVAYPDFDKLANIHLMSSNLELTMFLKQCQTLLERWGIPFPE